MQQLRRYLVAVFWWILDTPPLLAIGAAVLIISVVWLVLSGCLERQIRFVGGILQLLGVILVAVGLRDTRRAFNDQPTTWQAITQWWSGRPRLAAKHIALEAGAAAFGMSSMSARMRSQRWAKYASGKTN